jgi:hypothetical protein
MANRPVGGHDRTPTTAKFRWFYFTSTYSPSVHTYQTYAGAMTSPCLIELDSAQHCAELVASQRADHRLEVQRPGHLNGLGPQSLENGVYEYWPATRPRNHLNGLAFFSGRTF